MWQASNARASCIINEAIRSPIPPTIRNHQSIFGPSLYPRPASLPPLTSGQSIYYIPFEWILINPLIRGLLETREMPRLSTVEIPIQICRCPSSMKKTNHIIYGIITFTHNLFGRTAGFGRCEWRVLREYSNLMPMDYGNVQFSLSLSRSLRMWLEVYKKLMWIRGMCGVWCDVMCIYATYWNARMRVGANSCGLLLGVAWH